jgi:hypothetical protein
MLAVFDTIENLDADLIPEESLLQYLVRMGVASRVLEMAYPLWANDYAGDISEVFKRAKSLIDIIVASILFSEMQSQLKIAMTGWLERDRRGTATVAARGEISCA